MLASHFMQYALMKFGLCHLVIMDDSDPFKGFLIAMCKVLNLNYDNFAKRNY